MVGFCSYSLLHIRNMEEVLLRLVCGLYREVGK